MVVSQYFAFYVLDEGMTDKQARKRIAKLTFSQNFIAFFTMLKQTCDYPFWRSNQHIIQIQIIRSDMVINAT